MAAFGRWKTDGVVDDPIGTLVDALLDPLPTGIAVATGDTVAVGFPLPYLIGRRSSATTYHRRTSHQRDHLRVAAGPGDRRATGPGGDPVPAARLRLTAGTPARWSVLDDRGGAWFPAGATRRFDATGPPFFHGDGLDLDVPAGPLTVRVARGTECAPEETTVTPAPGETVDVALSPRRLYDAAAEGWYAADLHVHLNYPGDTVVDPSEVPLMQRGEGLHVLNLVAAQLLDGTHLRPGDTGARTPAGTCPAGARRAHEVRRRVPQRPLRARARVRRRPVARAAEHRPCPFGPPRRRAGERCGVGRTARAGRHRRIHTCGGRSGGRVRARPRPLVRGPRGRRGRGPRPGRLARPAHRPPCRNRGALPPAARLRTAAAPRRPAPTSCCRAPAGG